MKVSILFLMLLSLTAFTYSFDTLTKKERKTAAKFLKNSGAKATSAVSKLNSAQLNFKPAPDQWSVSECMMHIAATEKMLWEMVEASINAPANPDKRAGIKMTDEEVMNNIADRTNKVKTFPALEPQNTGFKTMDDAVLSFKENRAKLIEYTRTTKANLRDHVNVLPIGSFDAYQMILFIGAHSNRHVKQMEEVMTHPGFPVK